MFEVCDMSVFEEDVLNAVMARSPIIAKRSMKMQSNIGALFKDTETKLHDMLINPF